MIYEITTGGRRSGKSKARKLIVASALACAITPMQKAVKQMNEAADQVKRSVKHMSELNKSIELEIRNSSMIDMPKYIIEQEEPRLPGSFKHRSRR